MSDVVELKKLVKQLQSAVNEQETLSVLALLKEKKSNRRNFKGKQGWAGSGEVEDRTVKKCIRCCKGDR